MFSVIIPVHNKLPHLDRSVYSVLNQTFEDFEILLIDDASTDGSEEKIKEYDDPRIRLFHRDTPGPGGYAARNLGIKKAKHDWICFLDADDEWNPKHLEEKHEVIEEHQDVEIISTKWVSSKNGEKSLNKNFDKIRGKYKNFNLTDFLNFNSLIWTSAVTIKKELLLKSDLFPDGKCKRGGDLDTWVRCLDKSSKNIFINKIFAIYHKDVVNKVTDNKNKTVNLCGITTIENIRNKTDNKELHIAIDNYLSKHIYNIITRNKAIKEEKKNNLLKLIRSNKQRNKLQRKIQMYPIKQAIKKMLLKLK